MVFLDTFFHGKLFKEFINSDHTCCKHWDWSQPSITCHPTTLPNQIPHCLHNMAAILIPIQHLHPCLYGVQWRSNQSRHATSHCCTYSLNCHHCLRIWPHFTLIPSFLAQVIPNPTPNHSPCHRTTLEDACQSWYPKTPIHPPNKNSWLFP